MATEPDNHSRTTSFRRQRRFGVATALVGLAVATMACSSLDDAASTAESGDASRDVFDAPAAVEPAPADVGDDSDMSEEAPSSGGAGSPVGGVDLDLGTIGRQVVVEMRVAMQSDDLRGTVEGIMRSASSLGGGVASSDVDYGDGSAEPTGRERAVLTVKVPAGSLGSFLDGLDRLGTVSSIGQDAQDVTDQLTDLEIRIANAAGSVERVRALLTEAETLGDVIELEGELTRRQTDLERLQASERNIRDRVALSTVTIEVVPSSAATASPNAEPDDGIADAFRSGIDAFVAVVFGIAFVLAVATPFIVLAAIAAAVTWMVFAARRRRHSVALARRSEADPGRAEVTPSDDDDPDESVPVAASRPGSAPDR